MAKANLIEKKILLSLDEIIKFQIVNYCSLNEINLSNNELLCLCDLVKNGEVELSKYCMDASEKNFFNSPQSVRNFIGKASDIGLIQKDGSFKKKIKISEKLEIESEGNIIIKLTAIYAKKE